MRGNFVIEVVVVGGVDGFVALPDELHDGTFVVLAAVEEPLRYAYDDYDEEGDDTVVCFFIILSVGCGWDVGA